MDAAEATEPVAPTPGLPIVTPTQEFLRRLETTFVECNKILRSKNADYAGEATVDPFRNLRLIEVVTSGRVSTQDGILVRMCDKLQRAANLVVQASHVADESIEDTMRDAINYLAIWLVYREMSLKKGNSDGADKSSNVRQVRSNKKGNKPLVRDTRLRQRRKDLSNY